MLKGVTPLRVADDVVPGVLPQVRLLISESEATLGRSGHARTGPSDPKGICPHSESLFGFPN